ncbi:MAG: hypothetical protein ACE5KX_04875 [Acidimicrobiia bacterium]
MRRRRRRQALTWLAFGLVGLVMGVVWAVGVASSTAIVDTAGAAPAAQVFGTASVPPPPSLYATLLTADTPLTIGFTGQWGKIDADTPMFDVDLSAQSGTYFVDIYLTNNPTGWLVLQLEFRQVNKSCSDVTLGPADWAAPAATSVMLVENEDAYATFSGLAGGGVFCLGIQQITPKANDSAGTYIKRPKGGSPTAPSFAAVLNRTS